MTTNCELADYLRSLPPDDEVNIADILEFVGDGPSAVRFMRVSQADGPSDFEKMTECRPVMVVSNEAYKDIGELMTTGRIEEFNLVPRLLHDDNGDWNMIMSIEKKDDES